MKTVAQNSFVIVFLLFYIAAFGQEKQYEKEIYKTLGVALEANTKFEIKYKKNTPKPKAIINYIFGPYDLWFFYRTDYIWDSSGNVLSMRVNQRGTNSLVFVQFDTLTYNSDGKVVEHIQKIKDVTGQWNHSKIVSSYNSRGVVDEEILYSGDTIGNSWEIFRGIKYWYTYNSNNQPSEIIRQIIDHNTTTYQNEQKQVFKYGNNNEPFEMEFYTYNSHDSAWKLAYRAINVNWHNWAGTLHGRALINYFELEQWDEVQWIKVGKFAASFNNDDNLLSENQEIWDGSSYVPDYRLTCTYEPSGNLTGYFHEKYKATIPAWDTTKGIRYDIFFNNANSIDFIDQYNYRRGIWEKEYKDQYIYSTNDTFTNITKKTSQIALEVYPNPTKDVLNLKLDIKNFTFTITDLTGRNVLHAQIDKNIDVSNLKSGVYMLHINSEKGNAVVKFVKN